MRKEGRAEWVGGKAAGSAGVGSNEVWVWWRNPEEWATAIYEWVSIWCVMRVFKGRADQR